MKIVPGEIKTAQLHAYLLGSIGPRPICFASTIDDEGHANLSPFSFFNVFGSKPPIVVFSPARRVRDNTLKHTLENAMANKEVVINVVNYDMVQQMSLASCDYARGVDEFVKAGFTPIPSDMVKPFRVKESPVQLECKVLQVIKTGEEGGAGNLVICEVLCMHVNDDVLDAEGRIDPHKIDLVARMGGDFYCRASGDAVFVVPKPNLNLGVGVDALPAHIRNSTVLSGNDLGILGNSTLIPEQEDVPNADIAAVVQRAGTDKEAQKYALHVLAKELIAKHDVAGAWQALLAVGEA